MVGAGGSCDAENHSSEAAHLLRVSSSASGTPFEGPSLNHHRAVQLVEILNHIRAHARTIYIYLSRRVSDSSSLINLPLAIIAVIAILKYMRRLNSLDLLLPYA